MKTEFEEKKYRELVQYICHKTEPKDLGATKLNKILWYSDVMSYLFDGKPMTGETYIKRQHGPVPKHILGTTDFLKSSGDLCIRDVDYYGYSKREYIAVRKPDLSMFTGNEISMIDDIIEIICHDHTAQSISRLTHDRIWELAEIGEEIPYEAILASNLGEIDEDDIAWAQSVLAKAA